MEKRAPVDHPVHDLIARRWSPRAFADRPVPRDDLRSLLEAARWAPSSFNEQPWSLVVATRDGDREEWDRLLGCLVEANQAWARLAPVLMLSIASERFSKNDRENRHAFHDVGLAVMNLTVEATFRGLFVHQMAGIDVEKARETYALPEGQAPVAGIAIGYPGEVEDLPERFRDAERGARTRKSLSEFVYRGAFGETHPLAADD